jgi:GNAT superfamily N-acetyltransferase
MTNHNFVYPFVDHRDRQITVRVDVPNGDVTAWHEGQQIGYFEVWDSDDGPLAKFANLDEGYRGAGIGTEVMRRAFEYHGSMIPPPFNPALTDNRMSTAGLALMRAGQRRGWITEFPDMNDPSEDDDAD